MDTCLVKSGIRRAHLYPYLPVTRHSQIAIGAEMAFAIGKQVNVIGAHIHIEHGGVERYAHIRSGLTCTVIDDGHGENVGAETVRVDVQRDGELVVSCSYRGIEWLIFCIRCLLG